MTGAELWKRAEEIQQRPVRKQSFCVAKDHDSDWQSVDQRDEIGPALDIGRLDETDAVVNVVFRPM